MAKEKKILIFSPFKNDNNLYPHCAVFFKELANFANIDFQFFSERGLVLERISKIIKQEPLKKFSYQRLIDVKNEYKYLLEKYKNTDYDIVIAIDSVPYIIASMIFKTSKIILWSHDFRSYDESVSKNILYKLSNRYTRHYLLKNKSLIIQDDAREEVLLKSINVKKDCVKTMYMPVSLKEVNAFKEYNPNDKPMLMQIGGISDYRSYSDLLIKHYNENSELYDLTIHGYISDEIKILLQNISNKPVVSDGFYNPLETHNIVINSNIGFIAYVPTDLNFQNIRFASGQLVEFLRTGKPLIIMGKTNLNQFIEENKVGVSINSIDELNVAIKQITSNYNEYSRNCIQMFEKYYNIEKYINEFKLNFIDN
ncbi:MAG: hypothetical protein A2X12_07310 [Bacteroidetes bacterium GWE2_29_8]|nr:MAG: hypothetical protein A2X12_07310 [Bacteroidetes bacterium GWE2_29_8]OFY24586.1 MAG: hypothetical protein A2X02_03210 [Bacteroidetes bacterium GWF2_29_10]